MKIQKITTLVFILLAAVLFNACEQNKKSDEGHMENKKEKEFKYKSDQFSDLQILRYKVPGFENLPLAKKKLAYYLYEAGLAGRDIFYDQNYKHNLCIRKTIEAIVEGYEGDRNSPEFKEFMTYAKRVWFSNGIHHHYSNKKFTPGFSKDYFASLVKNAPKGNFPLAEGETLDMLIEKLSPILFDPKLDAKMVNQDAGADLVAESANNYYEGVTQKEVEGFYSALKVKDDPQPLMYGLNSKMVKKDGKVVEKVYKLGGMYSGAIEKIIFWLEKAVTVAENEQQKAALEKLIAYYTTGDLKTFDEYCIAWVKDTTSTVDAINGFIENYDDAMHMRGAFESVVSIKDEEASKRMAVLSREAQWFEDNSSIMDAHKKKNVVGVSYKVITVVGEVGDAAPPTPIGINLPNSNWIRQAHGSKAVSLGNIKEAYENASGGEVVNEFFLDEAKKARLKEHYSLASKLHTALHEVIGHASGQINEGVGSPSETLKNYASTLEEGRADLVALYYLTDPKLVEIGVMPSIEVGKAEYDMYISNGMMVQLRRLNEGDNIEEAHMRNRQIVASWAYEKGKADNVIEKKVVDGKTYFVVNDYEKLRNLFGQLLREIQRIKSEGDFEAGKALVETYGVKVDQDLLKEVKTRYEKLENAPYSGFIQPKLVPVEENGKIVDIKVEYPDDFVQQMMTYGKKYAFLPVYN